MSGVMGSEVNWLCGDRIGGPTMGLVAKGDSIRDKRNMNGGLHPVVSTELDFTDCPML